MQGVASNVARPPVRKSPDQPVVAVGGLRQAAGETRQRQFEPAPEIARQQRQQESHAGKEIRLLELEAPADGNVRRRAVPAIAPARMRKLASTPAVLARKLRRTRCGLAAPPWPTKASSLRESTGSTQGMRLRIRPPSKAASKAGQSESFAHRRGQHSCFHAARRRRRPSARWACRREAAPWHRASRQW